MSDTTWPTHGPDFNSWNGDFARFSALLDSVKDEPWWIWDSSLKYLNVRIDTRDNGFLLFADEEGNGTGKVRISPDRVAAAIEKYLDKYPSRRSLASQHHQGGEAFEDLLDQYFDIGVREGREKRDHDDMMGSAQLTREKIMAAFNADRTYPAALRDAKERTE